MSAEFHVVPAELGSSAGRVHESSANATNSVSAMAEESKHTARANPGWASADQLTACADAWSGRMHALGAELAGYAGKLQKASGLYEGADTKIAADLRSIAKELGD